MAVADPGDAALDGLSQIRLAEPLGVVDAERQPELRQLVAGAQVEPHFGARLRVLEGLAADGALNDDGALCHLSEPPVLGWIDGSR